MRGALLAHIAPPGAERIAGKYQAAGQKARMAQDVTSLRREEKHAVAQALNHMPHIIIWRTNARRRRNALERLEHYRAASPVLVMKATCAYQPHHRSNAGITQA